MKKIFDTKKEKITDRAFNKSLIIAVLGILTCLAALCSTTYAWFVSETSSSNNTIVASAFNVDDVRVLRQSEVGGVEVAVAPERVVNGTYSYSLPTGTYKMIFVLSDNSTAKGHCILKIGNVKRHTEAIIGKTTANKDGYVENDPFEFTFTVSEETEVEIYAVWGVNIDPFIKCGGEYSSDGWIVDNERDGE